MGDFKVTHWIAWWAFPNRRGQSIPMPNCAWELSWAGPGRASCFKGGMRRRWRVPNGAMTLLQRKLGSFPQYGSCRYIWDHPMSCPRTCPKGSIQLWELRRRALNNDSSRRRNYLDKDCENEETFARKKKQAFYSFVFHIYWGSQWNRKISLTCSLIMIYTD